MVPTIVIGPNTFSRRGATSSDRPRIAAEVPSALITQAGIAEWPVLSSRRPRLKLPSPSRPPKSICTSKVETILRDPIHTPAPTTVPMLRSMAAIRSERRSIRASHMPKMKNAPTGNSG